MFTSMEKLQFFFATDNAAASDNDHKTFISNKKESFLSKAKETSKSGVYHVLNKQGPKESGASLPIIRV